MSAALEQICAELGIKIDSTRKNPAAEIIPQKIIEHAQRGLRTKTALYLATMADFTLATKSLSSVDLTLGIPSVNSRPGIGMSESDSRAYLR